MLLKRGLLSVLFLASPLFLSGSLHADQKAKGQDQGGVSNSLIVKLDDLRNTCVAKRLDEQTKAFTIDDGCKGFSTRWEAKKDSFVIPTRIAIRSEVNTKDNRYTSQAMETLLQGPGQTVECSKWSQITTSTPEGVLLPVSISNCDDLTIDNLAQLCRGVVDDYCADNSEDEGQDQGAHGCTSEVTKTFDTCQVVSSVPVEQQEKQTKKAKK